MFSSEEATKERVAAYLAALDSEQVSYERRIEALDAGAAGNERLAKEQLEARIKGIDGERKRAKKLLKKDDGGE